MYSVVATDGKEYGPVDLATVQAWIAEGRIVPDTVIVDGVTQMRAPASQFPLIAPLFEQSQTSTQTQQAPFSSPNNPGVGQPNYSQPPNAYGQYPRAVGSMPVRENHVLIVVLLSIFIGGWVGNIMNGQVTKGIVVLVANILLGVVTCGFALIITWPVSLIDAILGARKVEQGHKLGEWEMF